jgi:hypothetical protein
VFGVVSIKTGRFDAGTSGMISDSYPPQLTAIIICFRLSQMFQFPLYGISPDTKTHESAATLHLLPGNSYCGKEGSNGKSTFSIFDDFEPVDHNQVFWLIFQASAAGSVTLST